MPMVAGSSTSDALGRSACRQRRKRAVFELVVAYVLILIVLWTPRPWQGRIYLLAAGFIVFATWRSWSGLQAMGWTGRNVMRSAWVTLAAAFVATVAVLVARKVGTLHTPASAELFLGRFVGYMIFACIQQFLLQDFFLLRLLDAGLKPGAAVFAAAGIFACAHLPSPILTVLTFIWGIAACAWFLRYRNLYALAASHMVLGITLAICIPGPTIRNMRVGLGYLTYRPPPPLHLSH